MRRLPAAAAAGLLMLGVLAGCSSDGDVSVDSGKVKVHKDGDKVTVEDGENSVSVGGSKLPDSFPTKAVPLPEDASLQAVIANESGGKDSYTLSYTIDGGDVASAAKDYKAALTDDGYRIESSAPAGASAAVFSAFTAIGTDWDVVAYSGGSSKTDAVLAVQVTTHDPAKDPDPDAEIG